MNMSSPRNGSRSLFLLQNSQGESFALPETLRLRCVRLYGWSEPFADKAIKAYLQFIKLKYQLEDWDAVTLLPSVAVDLVWRQHVLDVTHYVRACHEYCGGYVIGYNPDVGLAGHSSRDAIYKRAEATKLCVKTLFDRDMDPEVWTWKIGGRSRAGHLQLENGGGGGEAESHNPFAAAGQPPQSNHQLARHHGNNPITALQLPNNYYQKSPNHFDFQGRGGGHPMMTPPRTPNPYGGGGGGGYGGGGYGGYTPGGGGYGGQGGYGTPQYPHGGGGGPPPGGPELVMLTVVNQETGEHSTYKIGPETQLQNLFNAHAGRTKQDVNNLRFFRGAKKIDLVDTPNRLGLVSGDQIDVMVIQTGSGCSVGTAFDGLFSTISGKKRLS